MKLWFVLMIGMAALIGCGRDKEGAYGTDPTGAGGAGPGYDGTGSGPAATNVNQNPQQPADQ